ncbi:MAG: dihydroxyacetone kinase subunit L [Cyclobacteriaceae bacterium]|nr:dihydroxyacetone kinase subunit L [Cyclobacteriaceae bacterium]
MTSIDIDALKNIFGHLKRIMDENREMLIELDSVMGDGDLGITMQKAFTAAHTEVQGFTGKESGQLLLKAGMKIAQAAPSTMGTLVAMGFMKGGKSILKTEEISLSELSVFFRAFANGIMDAGKTKPGNKTIIDALDPAAKALEEASVEGKNVADGIQMAYTAAREGVENTKSMKAQHGRAAYYQEKSIGVTDAGATVAALILKGFYLGVRE